MAGNNQTLAAAIHHLMSATIPALGNDFFDPTGADSGESCSFQVNGCNFEFQRCMTSAPGQIPPHIAYRIRGQCGRLTVYVTYPQEDPNFISTRNALAAGFRFLLHCNSGMVMHQIDARSFI